MSSHIPFSSLALQAFLLERIPNQWCKTNIFPILASPHLTLISSSTGCSLDSPCVLDVGGGLMTTIVHIALKIKGYYCGLEICLIRSRFFTLSFQRLLDRNILINKKIAYVWSDLMCFTNFDFDKCFSNEAWDHMMRVFSSSPCCKFLIAFRTTKVQQGATGELRKMLKKYIWKSLVRFALQAFLWRNHLWIRGSLLFPTTPSIMSMLNGQFSIVSGWKMILLHSWFSRLPLDKWFDSV